MRRLVLPLLLALIAGCAPRTYVACMSDASAKPTDSGVRVAAAQCAKRFPDEYRALNASAAIDEFLAGAPSTDASMSSATMRGWAAAAAAIAVGLVFYRRRK